MFLVFQMQLTGEHQTMPGLFPAGEKG